jgi:hypothetical protein
VPQEGERRRIRRVDDHGGEEKAQHHDHQHVGNVAKDAATFQVVAPATRTKTGTMTARGARSSARVKMHRPSQHERQRYGPQESQEATGEGVYRALLPPRSSQVYSLANAAGGGHELFCFMPSVKSLCQVASRFAHYDGPHACVGANRQSHLWVRPVDDRPCRTSISGRALDVASPTSFEEHFDLGYLIGITLWFFPTRLLAFFLYRTFILKKRPSGSKPYSLSPALDISG